MSSPWLSCLIINQLLCISVVSTDKHLSVNFFESFYCSSHTSINCFDCFDSCCLYTSMTYHIRVCKIDNDHIIFTRFDCIHQLVTNFRCAHLRLKVISCNLRRFNEDSVFSFVWFFYSTVKEESNMCIFFCLSNTNLCHIMSRKIFTKCILKKYFVERNLFVLNCFIIICKADISKIQFLSSFETFEFIITECSCDLTCTVWTEVKEYYRIFVLDLCNRLSVFLNNCRKDEFICLIIIIGILNCCCSVCTFDTFTFCQGFVCKFYTIPAIISVHCIVTSGNNTDLSNTDFFHLGFQLFNEFFS